MLILKRITAYFIDNLIILLYAFLLLQITLLVSDPGDIKGPIQGQLVGFITLTLPAFLYLYLFEKSSWKATLGKRIMKIEVQSNSNLQLLKRNVLKMLPWEIAHTGIHWLINGVDPENVPLIIWVLLILPQLMVIAYVFGLVRSNGSQTLYDRWAGTEVEMKK